MKKKITLIFLFYSLITFSQTIQKDNDNLIYDFNSINMKPSLPGGIENINNIIHKKLSETGFKSVTDKSTKVISKFIVEKDGSLSDIKILSKIAKNKSDALITILQNLPKWSPGEQNGQIVRVLHIISLNINY